MRIMDTDFKEIVVPPSLRWVPTMLKRSVAFRRLFITYPKIARRSTLHRYLIASKKKSKMLAKIVRWIAKKNQNTDITKNVFFPA
jgi:hypothetical protein